ncbi:MAG: hypoxanthine phosphoribosyltransferase [Gammaproteobacteria bacterium]|nr:hypoxanthine phosphoribosyltransferase [Gammaproteobacteria bacterium]
MANKLYLDAQQLLEDSFQLGHRILQSGFRPTIILAIWRGGVPMGIAIQEYLQYHGIETNNIAIRTSSYSGIDNQSREVSVHGLNYIVKTVEHHDRLLIIDDVFDTGRSIEATVNTLRAKARLNTPDDIRIAVPYYKPSRRQVDFEPDYYLYETEEWLKYPHSLEGLSVAEIRENRPEIYEILREHLAGE